MYSGTLAVMAAVCAFWLWFMIRRPVQWLAFSDRADDTFVRLHLLPRSLAETSKRLARGSGKTLLIAIVTAGLVVTSGGLLYGTAVVLRYWGWLHW